MMYWLSVLYFFHVLFKYTKNILHLLHTKQLIFTQYKSIYISNATAVSD